MIDRKVLLECAQNGNADSFGLLYSEYAKELYAYAYKFLGNREDAEDAVQQASLNVYTHLSSVKKPEAFKAYYFKALANSARSILVKRNLHTVGTHELETLPDTSALEETSLDRQSLNEALAKLNDNEREIVLLSVTGGFNSAEIAHITGYTRGAVRSKLSRSLKKLKDELSDSYTY